MARAWLLVHPKGIVVRADDPRAPLRDDDVAALGIEPGAALDVASLAGEEVVAAALEASAVVPAGLVISGLRDLFAPLGEERFVLAGRATQIAEWATTSRFCGRCGTPTARVPGERAMACPKCGLQAYPRIAPAVIVLVRRGDEALLARNARFPLPFFSTLAGFVEPGETLEETIAREIREEVALEVKNPRYFGSQPWPFPHSLMVAFMADYAGGEIAAEPSEIAEAKWFRADALPLVPPRISIARRMIDAWVGEVRSRSA